jgi:hypothetical protein
VFPVSDDHIVREVPEASLIQSVPTGMKEFLSSVLDVNENGIYCDPDCPICNSSHRETAEQVWSQGDPYDKERAQKVAAHLLTSGETVSREVVLNHCASHLGAGTIELRKLEYIRKLCNMGSVRLTTLDRLEFVMAAVSERLLAAGALYSDGSTPMHEIEETRSRLTNQLAKTSSTLFSLHAQLERDMEEEGQIIRINREVFRTAFDKAVSDANGERERELINFLLTELGGSEL